MRYDLFYFLLHGVLYVSLPRSTTCEGVAVGAGWQWLVAYINIGCYYLVGLPAGILLGFTAHLGVMVTVVN